MKCIIISEKGKAFYVNKKELVAKKGWAKIKVMFSGLCGSDITKIFADKKSRLALKNEIWGHEFSGVVVDIEKNKYFKNGDRIAVQPLIFDKTNEITKAESLGKQYAGGFSEYALVPIRNLIRISNNLSFELASLLEPLSCSLHAYHLAGSPKNKKILIIGDGPIALSTLIICKKFNNRVTLLGKNKVNLKIATSLRARALGDSAKLGLGSFDSIFECVGRSQDYSLHTSIKALKPKGKIVVLGVFQKDYKNKIILRDLFFKEGLLLGSNCYLPKEFDASIKLLENEKLKFEKIITHILPLRYFKYGLNIVKIRKNTGR